MSIVSNSLGKKSHALHRVYQKISTESSQNWETWNWKPRNPNQFGLFFVSLKRNTNTVPWSRYMGKYYVRSSIEKVVTPVIIHFNSIFHGINHHFGVPPWLWKPPYLLISRWKSIDDHPQRYTFQCCYLSVQSYPHINKC